MGGDDDLVPRSALLRRQMSDGALAGTVVGVVVGVGLLALCLYPIIVCQIKRHRRPKTPHPDAENAAVPRPARPEVVDLGYHRRLSSSDSFKRDGELSRGVAPAAPRNKEWGLASHDQGAALSAQGHSSPWHTSSTATDAIAPNGSRAVALGPSGEYEPRSSPSPLPFYLGEYMPVSEVREAHPGVLRGTSADYYSPSIPSEAFGMITAPTDGPVDMAQASRTSSLKHSFRHMFRRTSGQNRTTASYDSAASAGDGISTSHRASALPRIVTAQDLAESPTAVSPTTLVPVTAASAPPMKPTPPIPLIDSSLKACPSPPSYPAPGTVNPMDIMPASTETEVWHRTEHELFASSHGPPVAALLAPDHQSSKDNDNSTDSAPSTALETPSTVVPSRTVLIAEPPLPSQIPEQTVQKQSMGDDPSISDIHSRLARSPSAMSQPRRHQRFLSDQSIPLQGPGSTDLSSHNTPSTQLDSPTPESLTSSDFRHSVSPQSVLSSVKTGVFRCDEPGCHQAFDQPHKLK